MLGTLIWRIKEAAAVFLGKKKTEKLPAKIAFPSLSTHTLPRFSYKNEEEKERIENTSIEFIFSEFKEERVNAGGNDFSGNSRLDPSLSTLKHYFPNAKFTVYSDFDLHADGVTIQKIEHPEIQNTGNPRHFYHLADYYKFQGMLNSEADVAIAIDSDMFVFSNDIFVLITLTQKFGFCVPTSSGRSMNFEIASSLDTIPVEDASNGFGQTCNITPMTLAKNSLDGRKYYEACCECLKKKPSRASIAMWGASWKTGLYPYFLPKEFCVVRSLEGMGNEILLHVGHKSVAEFYNVKV